MFLDLRSLVYIGCIYTYGTYGTFGKTDNMYVDLETITIIQT